ncbi:MAG: hypothetical protein CVV50_02790 [Spirochaetae bacterium HGW-Spirochaetae-6]|nr:MAG: hypothetical protein CVV50_02790 [Spirochaetae bacterium HGW-Spirochaetae-6]
MLNKFKEIKDVEDAIKAQLEAAKKKGEMAVSQIEKDKDSAIDKMREDIREKRHQLVKETEAAALKEADRILAEADSEIKKIQIKDTDFEEAVKLAAEFLISAE